MKTTIDKAGRLVIPKRLRDRAGFQPGAKLDVRFNEDGALEIALPAPKGEVVYKNGLPYWRTGRKINAGEIDRAIEQAREERLDAIVRSAWGTDEDRS
jgi:AbrB family looped-hinge helix DNA binding protein